jgi:hypothetical protein
MLRLFTGYVRGLSVCLKRSGPHDLVFSSTVKSLLMLDNDILCRFIKPAARKLNM